MSKKEHLEIVDSVPASLRVNIDVEVLDVVFHERPPENPPVVIQIIRTPIKHIIDVKQDHISFGTFSCGNLFFSK